MPGTTPIDKNAFPLVDFNLLIAMGVYPGITHVNKFGSIVNAVADTPSDVWDGGGTYTFPTAADMTHVSQTLDQIGARGLSVHIEGLDENWEPKEQTVTLDAANTTTPVALATPLLRINRMHMEEDVTLTSTVRLHNTAETIDYADIQLDHNQTLNAIYTIPEGYTAYVTHIEADYVPTATKNPDSVHFHCYQKQNDSLTEQAEDGTAQRAFESFGIPANAGAFSRPYAPYLRFPERTDLWINCEPTAKDAHVHASFDLILIQENVQ